MNERELIAEIGGIVRAANSLDEAVGRVESLLSREIGAATLQVRLLQSGSPVFAGTGVSQLLESRAFPFRALYTAPLRGDRPRETLLACFGTWDAPGELLQRVTAYTAEQLGTLLQRRSWRPEAA